MKNPKGLDKISNKLLLAAGETSGGSSVGQNKLLQLILG